MTVSISGTSGIDKVQPGLIGIKQTQYVASQTRATSNVTAFAEVNTAYRVAITPSTTTSKVLIHFALPINANGASNTIYSFRAFREVGGVKSYDLTTAGNTNGSRQVFAGITSRPPGYDTNDPMMVNFTVVDIPGTTSECTYGFEAMRESGGTGTLYFGYSSGDSAIWGFDINIVIIAQEVE